MYNYNEQKYRLLTDEGQRTFLKIRDNISKLLDKSGAVRLQEAIEVSLGDNWLHIACIDRMVELGEIREIPQKNIRGQDRIFIGINH